MLRRHADRILINNINPAIITDVVANVSVTIEGYGILNVANQIASHKSCTTAETPKQMTVLVVIPTTCECPYEWCMTVETLPNLQNYEVQTTFPAVRTYCFEDPAGGTPTSATTAAAIAARINADPFSPVTATVVGSTITLIGKAGVNFNAYTSSGTVATTVPYAKGVLGTEWMQRMFPIHWGMQGAQPTLPIPGEDYCEYHFTIRGILSEQEQDVDGANHWNDYEKEVYFYVRANDTNFAAWDVPVADLIPIANGGTL